MNNPSQGGGDSPKPRQNKYRSPARRASSRAWNNSPGFLAARDRWVVKDAKNAWAVASTARARSRARTAGLPFNIDKDYIRSIAPDICPVFGVHLTFEPSWNNRKNPAYSASLDRIEPALGYVVGNVAVISWKANLIKSSATAGEIRAVADWLESINQGCID